MLRLICIGIALVVVAQAASSPFVTVWRTTAPSESITLPFSVAPSGLNISWGDNSTDDGNTSHVYSVAGFYNVSIVGNNDITGFRFNSAQPDASKLMEIVSWGDGFVMDSTSTNVFAGCANLQVSAPASSQPVFLPGATLVGMFMNTNINSPLNWDLANVTSVASMFMGAKSMNQPLAFSNTLGVTSTAGMFQGATAFNQTLTMQTGNVVSMQSMFQGAVNFNQMLDFNTANVQSMSYLFYGASAFNQPASFNCSSLLQADYMFYNAANFNQPLTLLQTDNVVSMQYMFQGATSFNQPVNFNTGKVTHMDSMFGDANKFNQPINFDTTSLISARYMFYSADEFNSVVNFTNTSTLINISYMFNYASAFQQPITFQTDNVEWMDSMFSGASNFNQPVPFNTRNVQNMFSMFAYATSFNQPINFDGSSLQVAALMFSGATSFNSVVNLTNTSATLRNTQGMFYSATVFNQPILFQTDSVTTMLNMFVNARNFNQPVPFNTGKVQTMVSMFSGAWAFNQPINFNTTSLNWAMSMFSGASAFNSPVNFTTDTTLLTSTASMFENATVFNQTLGFSLASVSYMNSMFKGASAFNQPLPWPQNALTMANMFKDALGFEQDLRSWNVSKVTNCSNFCHSCGLPNFQLCVPCVNVLTSTSGMSVCNCPRNEFNISDTQCGTAAPTPVPTSSPTTPAPTSSPTTPVPTAPTPTTTGSGICTMVQVGPTLQVECVNETSSWSPSPTNRGFLTGIISPLFNITRSSNNNNNNTSNDTTVFVFTLPIDPQLFTSVGKISRPCESQQLSCEWQDPNTLEFQRSGCAVSKERVDMGSGVVGTECTCTHLTVFAIALRSELQLAPLCQAQAVDYVLLALYAILGVCLVVQIVRILKYQPVASCCVMKYVGRRSSRSSAAGGGGTMSPSSSFSFAFSPPPAAVKAAQLSLTQHSLMLLVCVLRLVYVAAKPVVGSLAGLVALGLLPSAITLSLFIHLLLTWAGLQFATFEVSPFARFRVPFVVMTLLVFAVVVVLAVLTAVAPEVDTVRDGSYVLAALYAVVCVLVLLSGLGMRKSISVVDALRATDWRVVFRCRLLVVTVGLSSCLFLVACLWVAAVQTDIVTSSAATLATTASFYMFDLLSLCVLMWLFSFGVKEAIRQKRGATKDSSREATSSRRNNKGDTSSRENSLSATKHHAVELDT